MVKEDGRSFLAYVSGELRKTIQDLGVTIEEGQRDIEQMHEYYWENYTEMDQYGYENYDNQQALFNQISANEESRAMRKRLVRMLDNPFFGRVDFCYEGEDDPEIFYIGIGNYAIEPGQIPLIFDWRAPVSGLFYDFDKGEASYEAPMGELRGTILSKWQYKISGGRMIYEFESDVKIDDEVLKAELGAKGEDKLKNIIRTIQKEQNAIIRNTSDRILVIQGAAGSGKTSVALHRIAYLLYHDRKNLHASNILILSPNGIFADYISHILPELGEENIRELTFDLYAYRQLQGIVADCEDRQDLLEKELAGLTDRADHERIAYKQTRDFVSRLEGFIFRLEDELMDFYGVEYRGYRMSEEMIMELFYEKFSEIPLLARMEAIWEKFVDEYETLKDTNIPEEEMISLRGKFLSMYETTDLYELYSRFLQIEALEPLPDLPPDQRELLYEDVYPLLYLKTRLYRQAPDRTIRHLVIDEMQDYSWLQFALLGRMFSCRMTILGDLAQTMDAKLSDAMSFLPEIFGKDLRRIYMRRCYRNTMEIAGYAAALTGYTDVELMERHGDPVEEAAFSWIDQALEAILTHIRREKDSPVRFETACIITMTQTQATKVYLKLKAVLEASVETPDFRLSCLDRNSTSFNKGLTVTTFYLSKGLEFDEVYMLCPPPASDDKDLAALLLQAKYIGATRAMHRLHVYQVGQDW